MDLVFSQHDKELTKFHNIMRNCLISGKVINDVSSLKSYLTSDLSYRESSVTTATIVFPAINIGTYIRFKLYSQCFHNKLTYVGKTFKIYLYSYEKYTKWS